MRGVPRQIKNARNAQTRRSTALQAQSTKITTCVSANCFAGHINHLHQYDTIICGKRQIIEDMSFCTSNNNLNEQSLQFHQEATQRCLQIQRKQHNSVIWVEYAKDFVHNKI